MFHETINLLGSTYLANAQSDVIDLANAIGFSAHFVCDDTTPAAATFTVPDTNILNVTGHGYTSGTKVRVSSAGTLPDGLAADTDYYVIYKTANTFKLSDTAGHAVAGTDIIAIADAGTGVHTVTATVGAFTAADTDICTLADNKYATGLKVRVSSADTLPAGLLADTDYFVHVEGPNTFKLSDTYAHAIANTGYINITDAGVGEHTITPTVGAFTATIVAASDTDTCYMATHGYTTGLKVRVSTAGTLPAGLQAATDYWVVVVAASTFKLSDSYVHALAGTNIIDISDAGIGTHTMTPTVISGSSIKLQSSNDNTNWDDIASVTENITADGNVVFNCSDVYYRYARAYLTVGTGRIAVSGVAFIKSP